MTFRARNSGACRAPGQSQMRAILPPGAAVAGSSAGNPTAQRRLTHALFVALLVVYVSVFHGDLQRLAGVWAGDGAFQYGFLIAPISLFLIWLKRLRVAGESFSPSPGGLVLLAGCVALWLLGSLLGAQIVQQFALIAALPALVLAVYGPAVVRVLLFPLLYLFFAFPGPVEHLTVLLQHITARFSVLALQLTGFTVVLHGTLIETPAATWHVEQACSGIKFFLASLALGALYAHLFYRTLGRRIGFMVAAFLVPIFANGLRVYFEVVIGETFGVQYATGTDHMIFGWQFFGTVLLLLFLAGWPWRQQPHQECPATPATPVPGAGGARVLSAVAVAGLLLLAGPGALSALQPANAPAPLRAPPTRAADWRLLLPGANPLGAQFRNPEQLFLGTYVNDKEQVNVLSVTYAGRPRHSHKLFMTGNRWFDSGQWRRIAAPSAPRLPRSLPVLRQAAVLEDGGQRRLVWYGYAVNGEAARGLPGVKWRQLREGLLARPLATRLLVLSTPIADGPESAARALAAFARAYTKWPGEHGRRP